jgi:hypothetical protein
MYIYSPVLGTGILIDIILGKNMKRGNRNKGEV